MDPRTVACEDYIQFTWYSRGAIRQALWTGLEAASGQQPCGPSEQVSGLQPAQGSHPHTSWPWTAPTGWRNVSKRVLPFQWFGAICTCSGSAAGGFGPFASAADWLQSGPPLLPPIAILWIVRITFGAVQGWGRCLLPCTLRVAVFQLLSAHPFWVPCDRTLGVLTVPNCRINSSVIEYKSIYAWELYHHPSIKT